MHSLVRILFLTLLAGILSTSCVSAPYSRGANLYRDASRPAPVADPQIERGRPNVVIDSVGWVLGIPGKILLWDRRLDNHSIGPETEQATREYLAENGLDKVKVRLNQYAPVDEFRRLVGNSEVGAGWRCTVGAVQTILPGRLFGGDNYNPWTNTISLYSDIPAVALHEGGHAKDLAEVEWKGSYSILYVIPFVPLWHEKEATDDALSYLRARGDTDGEKEAYRILYPAYATYIGGTFTDLVPQGDLAITAITVIPGHIIGRWKAAHLEDRLRAERAELVR
jgi:hypothetical protein